MRLTVLGSGDAFGGAGCNAAALVDSRVLVDCGAPIQVLLPRAGFDIHEIDLVLITHFHADHTFMLPVFLGARAFTAAATARTLTIAGPVGTREYVRRLIATGYGQATLDFVDERLQPEFIVLQDGSNAELSGYAVTARSVVHSTGPSLAYTMTRSGQTIGVSGDSTLCAGLVATVRAADVMLCECSGLDGPLEGHLWRQEVAELMATHPQTRFVLFHMPRRSQVPGAVIAHDLLSLELA